MLHAVKFCINAINYICFYILEYSFEKRWKSS